MGCSLSASYCMCLSSVVVVTLNCGHNVRTRLERESQQAMEELRRRLEVQRVQLVHEQVMTRGKLFTHVSRYFYGGYFIT